MIGTEAQMPDLTEADLYCREAQSIVVRAEEIRQFLSRNGACEGHCLIVAQAVLALKRLNNSIERHRDHLAFEALPNAISPPARIRNRWWSKIRWRARRQDVFEART
jgi:hypothetical protein